MKKLALYIALSLFFVSWLPEADTASDLKKADELFEKNTYQEALKMYEAVFEKTTDKDIRWKAYFRACESLAHLFRYGEAAQMLLSTPVTSEMPHRARILILKTEIFRRCSIWPYDAFYDDLSLRLSVLQWQLL